jgi:hypothetical protein
MIRPAEAKEKGPTDPARNIFRQRAPLCNLGSETQDRTNGRTAIRPSDGSQDRISPPRRLVSLEPDFIPFGGTLIVADALSAVKGAESP